MDVAMVEVELTGVDDEAVARRGFLAPGLVGRATVDLLVAPQSLFLGVTDDLRQRLGLATLQFEFAQLDDGSFVESEVVGPLRVTLAGRSTILNAVVVGRNEEPGLGRLAMKALGLVVDPATGLVSSRRPGEPWIVIPSNQPVRVR